MFPQSKFFTYMWCWTLHLACSLLFWLFFFAGTNQALQIFFAQRILTLNPQLQNVIIMWLYNSPTEHVTRLISVYKKLIVFIIDHYPNSTLQAASIPVTKDYYFPSLHWNEKIRNSFFITFRTNVLKYLLSWRMCVCIFFREMKDYELL